VTYNTAVSILSASARAGVDTFPRSASFLVITVRIDGAFGPTSWWTSHVSRQTWTHCVSVLNSALAVWPTQRWLTWVNFDGLNWKKNLVCQERISIAGCRPSLAQWHTWWRWWLRSADRVSIPNKSRSTGTTRRMVQHETIGILST